LSAEVVVERSAKTPVSGAGEAGPDEVGEGEEAGSDELLAVAGGDVLALDPGTVQPAMRNTTANQDVFSFTAEIIASNEFLRIGLRFRYDPASEAGPDPHPQSPLEGVRDGRHLLSVLFYLDGGIVRTLNLAEVTSHRV
jgi:hypothetical protein